MKVPFLSFEYSNRQIRADILSSFEHFFDNTWYILGGDVQKFEQDYASFNTVKYCIGVSNGLDALHLALRTLGVGKDDEVIVPSNTYIATVLAISYVGATPVFVEPDPGTYNINPVKIEEAITPLTRAIIPVHLYGQACDMERITEVAEKHGLLVIEDNAQSHGASFNGKLTGSWGHINGTSFYPGKNLGAFGDAGAITTNDPGLAAKASVLRNYGSEKKYFNETIGYNMRMDECQAGFLSVKLKYLKEWNRQRQEIARWYFEALKDKEDVILPVIAKSATHVFHQFVIRTSRRNSLQKYLSDNNVGTLIHYPIPPHLQKAYQYLGLKKGAFPISEEIADTCLSLPVWPGLQQTEVDYIAEKILDFYKI
jgi:dTDP-4-amino-4,6-dideoxygalactose transaminase